MSNEIVYRIAADASDPVRVYLETVDKLIGACSDGCFDYPLYKGQVVIFQQWDEKRKKNFHVYGMILNDSPKDHPYVLVCPLYMVQGAEGDTPAYLYIGKIPQMKTEYEFVAVAEKTVPVSKEKIYYDDTKDEKDVILKKAMVKKVLIRYRDFIEKVAYTKHRLEQINIC